jgi:hypothetical protein
LGSARSGAAAAQDPDFPSVAQMLAELGATLPPPELAAFSAAAINSQHSDLPGLHLTPQRLAVLGKSIELLSGKRCPALMKQKRDYIAAWWRLALARSAHTASLNSPQPATPVRRQEYNPLRLGEEATEVPRASPGAGSGGQHEAARAALTPTQRAALKRLLDGYGAPRAAADGAWEVLVPNEHLHIVCSQVAQLTGQTTPRQPRAKREWLAEVSRIVA